MNKVEPNPPSAAPGANKNRDLQLLFGTKPPISFSEGHFLFHKDDEADAIFLIKSGMVEISIFADDGKKLIANMEREGALIGEVAVIDSGTRTASAICQTDCQIYVMTRSELLDRFKADVEVSLAFMRLLCGRIRWISNEMEDQALLDTKGRLAKRLLQLQRKNNTSDGWIRISQQELAEFVGAARESVNRVFREFKEQQLIEQRRGVLRVTAKGEQVLNELIGSKELMFS